MGGGQNFSKFSETSLNICAPPRDFFLKFEGSWPRVYMLYSCCIRAMYLCVRVSGTYLYSCYAFVRACVWDVFVFVLCICAPGLCVRVSGTYLYLCYVFVRACMSHALVHDSCMHIWHAG